MNFFPTLSPETWTLLAAFVTLLILYEIWPYRVFKKLGIPGPRPLPFFGTFLEYRNGMFEFDQKCFQKYGKVWGIFDGRQPILAVLDPDIIKTVLVKEFHNSFPNRRNILLNGRLTSGLTVAEYHTWKRIRTIISPTFTSGKLKEMLPIIKHYGKILVQNIEKKVEKNEPVNMKEIFGSYSLDVVTSTSFGVDIDSMNNPNDPFVNQINKLLSFRFLSPLLLFSVVFPFLMPLLVKMNLTVISQESLEFFAGVIHSFKEKRQKGVHTGRVDFLQLMVDAQSSDGNSEASEKNHSYKEMTDMEISAQSIIFIFAGFQTTSLTLNFVSYNLATHPEVQKKLQEEIDSILPNKASPTYESISQMDYLDMVVQETLRLFPPGGRLERVCKETIQIKGLTIPKGTVVTIPAFVLHRDPEHWPEPEEFRPERFSKEEKALRDPYVFLPFGAGPRNCLGMRFALLNMKAALITLLQNFSMEPCKETPIPLKVDSRGFMKPMKPVLLKLIPRSRMDSED
ncbi:cytochrome P450 3A24-like [Tachyglossus aculeatus]|uniref:cytochrome P450 3A24-like n=1 Tax=Tachyglossus aculeatus TaxID=9261 RepID=UPI0018F3156D|nr:cytochrome P450 3A24-like [Tachyglossus aculeatus]